MNEAICSSESSCTSGGIISIASFWLKEHLLLPLHASCWLSCNVSLAKQQKRTFAGACALVSGVDYKVWTMDNYWKMWPDRVEAHVMCMCDTKSGTGAHCILIRSYITMNNSGNKTMRVWFHGCVFPRVFGFSKQWLEGKLTTNT